MMVKRYVDHVMNAYMRKRNGMEDNNNNRNI